MSQTESENMEMDRSGFVDRFRMPEPAAAVERAREMARVCIESLGQEIDRLSDGVSEAERAGYEVTIYAALIAQSLDEIREAAGPTKAEAVECAAAEIRKLFADERSDRAATALEAVRLAKASA